MNSRLTCNEDGFAVIDKVFSEEHFYQFWKYFNMLPWTYSSSQGWLKVWKVTDGAVLQSTCYKHSEAPFNCQMDWLQKIVYDLAKSNFSKIVGIEGQDWDEISFTPYLYPPGTKISWHDDGVYSGAAIFYTHPYWNAHWAGELMLAKTPIDQNPPETDYMSRKDHSEFLNYYGIGQYIAPIPNRLVFTKGNLWHSINRVDSAAGDNVRCSVVAFFKKSNPDQS